MTESQRLNQQIERVLDEDNGGTRSKTHTVIVRMATPGESRGEVIDSLAQAVRARRTMTSPGDLELPQAETVKNKNRSRGQRRSLAANTTSATAQVATKALDSARRSTLKRQGRQAVTPLLRSSTGKQAMARLPDEAKPADQIFWAAGAVIMDVTDDELRSLPEEVPGVEDILPNRRLDIPSTVEASGLPANVADNLATSWGTAAVGAPSVWGAFDARGQGVKVAVLDTGIDDQHPDLVGKVADFAEFDANGNQVPGAPARDSHQHGTHVAGTIVGGRASGLWVGVAPEAKVLAGLVLNGDVGGTDAQILAGIDWALDSGADVINMSLGGLTLGPEPPATYAQAILTCLLDGVPVVTAIGNDGSQTSGSPGNDFLAFSVGATDVRERPAGFSGGRTHVITSSPVFNPQVLPLVYSTPQVCGPGVAVQSTVPGGGYASFNGTSMATPHVAGVMALVLSATGRLTSVPAQERAFLLQDLLISTVEELGEAGQDDRHGWGRVDALRAVGRAKQNGF